MLAASVTPLAADSLVSYSAATAAPFVFAAAAAEDQWIDDLAARIMDAWERYGLAIKATDEASGVYYKRRDANLKPEMPPYRNGEDLRALAIAQGKAFSAWKVRDAELRSECGVVRCEEDQAAVEEEFSDLVDELMERPAVTLAGLLTKARIALAYDDRIERDVLEELAAFGVSQTRSPLPTT